MIKADIQKYLDAIMEAEYGEEVRGSIHDAIWAINQALEAGGGSGGGTDMFLHVINITLNPPVDGMYSMVKWKINLIYPSKLNYSYTKEDLFSELYSQTFGGSLEYPVTGYADWTTSPVSSSSTPRFQPITGTIKMRTESTFAVMVYIPNSPMNNTFTFGMSDIDDFFDVPIAAGSGGGGGGSGIEKLTEDTPTDINGILQGKDGKLVRMTQTPPVFETTLKDVYSTEPTITKIFSFKLPYDNTVHRGRFTMLIDVASGEPWPYTYEFSCGFSTDKGLYGSSGLFSQHALATPNAWAGTPTMLQDYSNESYGEVSILLQYPPILTDCKVCISELLVDSSITVEWSVIPPNYIPPDVVFSYSQFTSSLGDPSETKKIWIDSPNRKYIYANQFIDDKTITLTGDVTGSVKTNFGNDIKIDTKLSASNKIYEHYVTMTCYNGKGFHLEINLKILNSRVDELTATSFMSYVRDSGIIPATGSYEYEDDDGIIHTCPIVNIRYAEPLSPGSGYIRYDYLSIEENGITVKNVSGQPIDYFFGVHGYLNGTFEDTVRIIDL